LGMATVTNSTVTGNTATTTGGGIYNYSGTLTVTNTIVAANAATSGADLSGLVATGGHNLFGTTSGATITLGSGDLVNPNPRLGPLGNNGGPTQTVPLLKGSSTIDAGDDAVCAQTGAGKVNNVDQRGVTRPFGAHCDIGAFEYQEPNALPAPRPGGTPGGVPNALPGSRPAGTTGGPTPNPLPAPRP
nr:hypothetical protein [Chloroflexota bacterium]